MFYKIKGDDLVMFEENILGNKGNKVMSVALKNVGVIEFNKVELKAVKTLLADKNKFAELATLVG